ncbi:hypothetical protein IGI04_025557 [Brassica rapa subsp. trilocularis]|uniref:Phytosulfokine-beta n=1 Tax=Brassica rapa subsp. trilocularis TaxID=1813537 RepID=A0ABQ7KTF8_BRACM|nr:hypothetical protein IGI04_025557 [Brassica rapa subsp. trilocularis]
MKVEMTYRRNVDGSMTTKMNQFQMEDKKKHSFFFLVFGDKKKKNCKKDYEEQMVENMTPSPMSEAVEEDEGLISSSTMEELAATKKYIEDHYNKCMA